MRISDWSSDVCSSDLDSVARQLPEDSGFAGFRLQESTTNGDWQTHDWVAFLGASYFRAIGALEQYGLSARGIALNVAVSVAEEFPDFTEFYIAPATADPPVAVYALLNGHSVAGASHLSLARRHGVGMEWQTKPVLHRG